jgi:hypothetical protein
MTFVTCEANVITNYTNRTKTPMIYARTGPMIQLDYKGIVDQDTCIV